MSLADQAWRYVAWLERRATAVIVASVLVLAAAVYGIAFHLPIYADLSYLLPQDAPAVRDLRELEQRLPAKDTAIVVIVAPDAGARAAAAAEVAEGLRALPGELVERVDVDDAATRAYVRGHKHLFVPLPELIAARDALANRISSAKLHANPLFIDLDDDADSRARQEADDKRRLDDLRAKRRDAEGKLDRSGFVSADGKTAMIVVKTSFRGSHVGSAYRLVAGMQAVLDRVARGHPGVELGLSGGPPTTVAEHRALVRGILWSSVITFLLVALVLLLLVRSLVMLVLLTVTIGAATAVSVGLAAITVGHLNAATAFLGAVIAGNGVNYGVLLIARYLEERRKGAADLAMATAITHTLRPTLVAALGTALAYGALVSTSFDGFADFGVIGGAGMIVCWLATYTLLPALVLKVARGHAARSGDGVLAPIAGAARIGGPGLTCVVAAVVVAVAAVLAARFVAGDPFEYDLRELRSDARDAVATRHWMDVADAKFGNGVWSKSYVLVHDAARVSRVLATIELLRATPEGRATLGPTFAITDVVPAQQPAKLAVLAEIRRLLDDDALDALTPSEAAELRELRPPDDLRAVTANDLPDELRRRLSERPLPGQPGPGPVGRLISIRPGADLDEWDGHALLRLAEVIDTVRATHRGAAASGTSLIFADMIASIRDDGPTATLIAAALLALMLIGLVGANRRALAVGVSTVAGTVLMLAACAVVGLRVNFLDFIALPIALGISVDYAVNIAERAGTDDARLALRTTGAAVLACSLTTLVGYASLLVSDNHAIRSFGVASLIGELCCLVTALVLVPAVICLGRRAPAA